MNGKYCIFLLKKYSKSIWNHVLLISVKKDPVSTDNVIPLVRYVF